MIPEPFAYLLSAVAGYLLGSVPFGLVIARAAGFGDIREKGSGNIGATNVLRATERKDLAAATFLLDSGKAAIAVLIARALFGQEAGFIAGAAAFIGHCWPVWLKYKGGKGVATFFGVLFAALPIVGVFAGLTWLMTAFVFRFSSLAALAAAALAPVLAYFAHAGPWGVGFCLAVAAAIYWRHKANIVRLAQGTESKIGEKRPEDEDEE